MSDLNRIVTKLAEAARHVILTGEGITQLDEALSEYDKFSELADVVVDSDNDTYYGGCCDGDTGC